VLDRFWSPVVQGVGFLNSSDHQLYALLHLRHPSDC
jgi:hypothetical protein